MQLQAREQELHAEVIKARQEARAHAEKLRSKFRQPAIMRIHQVKR